MVGFAATASFRSSAPPSSGDAYGSLVDQISRFDELSGPPVVVFQDLDEPTVAATFGEVMCTTYQAFGSVGLITSGAGRDLDQVRAIGFPTFTGGTICAHGYCHILHIHVPVHVGGVAVYPDDLLHGDLNGVTTIPKEIAPDLPDVGDEFIAAEAILIKAMQEESLSIATLREARKESKSQIAKLGERVASRR
jgi:regulator of RNase E activity RraA